MTEHFTLKLAARTNKSKDDASRTFYWPATGASSFTSPFGPRLGAIGAVKPANVDLVRLALLVLAADRTVPREGGGTNWARREFSITVPVHDGELWNPVAGDLGQLLGLLTGDRWRLSFGSAKPSKETVKPAAADELTPERVVLVSGGADSALGALYSRESLASGGAHVLVSHVGADFIAPIQRTVAESIAALVPGRAQTHTQVRISRRKKQVDNTAFRNEFSTRSRSLLFLALGLAVASLHDVPVWIPENGFASLNPPLTANRRGSLSTRTTHPGFLEELSRLLGSVGAQSEIVNPFADLTKGEMFRQAADRRGDGAVAEFLSATHSCGQTGQRTFGLALRSHCGVCFGCVLRRASFDAADLADSTFYASDMSAKQLKDLAARTGKNLRAWLDSKSVTADTQAFVRRGVSGRDLATMGLPHSYPLAAADSLCKRAIKELEGFVS